MHKVSSMGVLKSIDVSIDNNDQMDDEMEQERARKEKVKWKHMKDEEQRQKLLLRLKEKLEQPETIPELYDPRKVEEEREMIENAIKHSEQGERQKENARKEHNIKKYQKYWEKSHAAKLSEIRKYDLSQFRFKDINKNPQNILVFNGKLLEYLQKMSGNQINNQKMSEKNTNKNDL